ncbi:stress responsive A/B barrel domain protein [Hypoxylon fuscum]|nr:stress responsive A/B barrel domain protein [Hypoxylon fuscum]
MTIYHIVQIKFKDLVPPDEVRAACSGMNALPEMCVHPTTQKKYIKSVGGGKDNSPEGLQNGMTHAFVYGFENEDDRKYYLEKDPKHMELVSSIEDIVEKVQVVDFTHGVF